MLSRITFVASLYIFTFCVGERNKTTHPLLNELHYSSYLKDVLELINGDIDHNGRIGHRLLASLGKVSSAVRSQLDQLKATEIKRINELLKEIKIRDQPHPEEQRRTFLDMSRHINPKYRLFTTEDLRSLLVEANAELAILNNYRKEGFQEYEMHKRLEFEELVNRIPDQKRAEVLRDEKRAYELEAKHRQRRPEHLPLSKQHLIKVWEEKDKLDKENFNIKTFFHLHDLNGDGLLDETELRSFMTREFEIGDFEQDEVERQEQIELHLERAFEVGDINKDHVLDINEFIMSTPGGGQEDHKFWEHMHDLPLFTEEEYEQYAEEHRSEVNKLIEEGKITLDLKGVVHHEGELEDNPKTEKNVIL